ncbi:MAG: DUF2007 domain-containing protein [Prevotellaceae bacterium]|jgi:SHS2 domain-containing protein|nr:DUF2007 domain-containing protein [Prevotellaceae bacterium]
MEQGWIKIYESADAITVELLRQRLEEENICAVVLNHRDSELLMLNVGEVELYVHESDKEAAAKYIPQS